MEQFKKHLAYVMLLIVALLSATACSNGVEGIMESPTSISEVETPEIILELQNFNATLEPITNSRGIGWVGWLTVVLRDGTGAYHGGRGGAAIGSIFGPHGATAGAIIGGAVLGAAQSYQQYDLMDKIARLSTYSVTSTQPTKATFTAAYSSTKAMASNADYSQHSTVVSDTSALKIAFLHNAILEDVQSTSPGHYNESLSSNLSEIEAYVVNSTAFTTLYKESIESITSDTTIEVDERTIADEIMNLFLEAVRNSCTSQTVLNAIIAYYDSAVENSDKLNEVEKLSLKAGFAVTGYSFAYWSTNWPYQE